MASRRDRCCHVEFRVLGRGGSHARAAGARLTRGPVRTGGFEGLGPGGMYGW